MSVTPKEAFEAMVRQNADMLWAFLMTVVRDARTADDLFRETFQAAWQKLATYDSEKPFGKWLRELATGIVSSKRRTLASGKMNYFDEETIALLEVQFERLCDPRHDRWDEKVTAVEKCIEALPKPAQELVSLYYNKNYNCREISSRLGHDQEKVKKRMQRSRKILLDCVNSKLMKK